jgi:hypothetical protein
VNETRPVCTCRKRPAQRIEIVDLASREVVDELTLSHDSVIGAYRRLRVHPSDDRAVIVAKRYTALADRYLVEGPFLLEYDLRSKQVTDTIPWPDDEPRGPRGQFRYSPDGETLYFFVEDIIASTRTPTRRSTAGKSRSPSSLVSGAPASA